LVWIIIAVVFSAAWVYAFYREDRRNPEPLWMIGLAIAAGAGAYFAADRVEGLILRGQVDTSGPLLERLRLAYLVSGPVEESAKFLAVLILIIPWTHFDEPMDGVVYAAVAGATFAFIENLAFMRDQPQVILARGPAGTGAHVMFSVLWGGALGFAGHIRPFARQVGHAAGGLLVAIAAHGTFNLVTFSVGQEINVNMGRALQIGLIVACALVLRWRMRAALTTRPFRFRAGGSHSDAAGGSAA
jgi:RsiW-degrading membrane proteinase PrsW (M82 family)